MHSPATRLHHAPSSPLTDFPWRNTWPTITPSPSAAAIAAAKPNNKRRAAEEGVKDSKEEKKMEKRINLAGRAARFAARADYPKTCL